MARRQRRPQLAAQVAGATTLAELHGMLEGREVEPRAQAVGFAAGPR